MNITRRNILTASAGLAAAALTPSLTRAADVPLGPAVTKGRVNQSVCQWCFKWPMEEFCANAQKLGLKGIDLVGPDWFPTLKKYNLIGTMTPSHSIPKGLNRKENWDECLGLIRNSINATADAGFEQVICFSGNRAGMDDETGLKNCTEALKQVVGLAEQKKVVICMELLNSKTNHHDYMCDRTPWGAQLVDAVGSEHFKLLYDIYHMQVDEGDVIATIKKYHTRIAHYHTAGVPGRNEIDDSQELHYPAIMRAILDTGYKGIVAQEFLPKHDPYQSLDQAIRICDV